MPFYLLERVALVVFLCDVGGMNVAGVFPCVVTFWIPFPLDEVLEAF